MDYRMSKACRSLVPIRCNLFIDKVVRSLKTTCSLSRLDYVIQMCKKVSSFQCFLASLGFRKPGNLHNFLFSIKSTIIGAA